MVYKIPTRYEPLMVSATVRTSRPEKICVLMQDAEQPNTVFTSRYNTVNGQTTFKIKCPVTGPNAKLFIYNDRFGNVPGDGDKTFEVLPLGLKQLKQWKFEINYLNPDVASFISFATRFCFNAGWLNSAAYGDGKFQIQYLPKIISDKGAEMNTPARISRDGSHIQVSQQKFIPMTIPMRMAIMLHEFSHFYLNKDIDNESEADLNALSIYLNLGYPVVEGSEAFTKTFIGTPTQGNLRRYQLIKRFIDDWRKTHVDE